MKPNKHLEGHLSKLGRYLLFGVLPGIAIWTCALSFGMPSNRGLFLAITLIGLGSLFAFFAILFIHEMGPTPDPATSNTVRSHIRKQKRLHIKSVAGVFLSLIIYAVVLSDRFKDTRVGNYIPQVLFGLGALAMIYTTYRVKCPKCGSSFYHIDLDDAQVCPYCRADLDSQL